ncbi:hypothetical protein Tco_0582552 [Tanacetum coccineum]
MLEIRSCTREIGFKYYGVAVGCRLQAYVAYAFHSRNTIGLALWNEMALEFGLQLSGTFATHYYLNPNIPEAHQIRKMHTQLTYVVPILDIESQHFKDLKQERTRNRFPLSVQLGVNPQNYQRYAHYVRVTGLIGRIEKNFFQKWPQKASRAEDREKDIALTFQQQELFLYREYELTRLNRLLLLV